MADSDLDTEVGRVQRRRATTLVCRSWSVQPVPERWSPATPEEKALRRAPGAARLQRLVTSLVAVAVVAAGLSAVAALESSSASTTSGGHVPPPTSSAAVLSKLPVRFEANVGQFDPAVRFAAHLGASTLLLTATGALLSLPPALPAGPASTAVVSAGPPSTGPVSTSGDVVAMELVGANPAARSEGHGRLAGSVNYLVGDQSRWHHGVPTFASVTFHDVYPGVDLVYRGVAGGWEYDFVVAPGADPSTIAWAVSGGSVRLDGADLVVAAAGQELRQHRPVIFQNLAGRRRPVAGGFDVHGDRVGFAVAGYDRSRPLVIDPVVEWQYWPGQPANAQNGGAGGETLALDSANNVYVAGMSSWPLFPTTPPSMSFADGVTTAGSTAFSSATANFTAADVGEAIVGTDPTTPIVINTTIASVTNATTATLSATASTSKSPVGFTLARPYKNFADGAATAGSTTFTSASAGFTAADAGKPITSSVLAAGTTIAAVTNATTVKLSAPASASATGAAFSVARALRITQGGLAAETSTMFVFKLNATGTALIYSTFLGGSHYEAIGSDPVGIAVDSAGNAYVTGETASADYPTTANAYSRSCGADGACNPTPQPGSDGQATAGSPIYTAFATGFGVSEVGDAISGTFIQPGTTIVGYNPGSVTLSKPATGTGTGLSYTVMTPWQVAVVSKLDAYGSSLLYSSFLGGSNLKSHGTAIALGGSDTVYVAGDTLAFDFPTTAGAYQSRCGSDGYCGALQTGGASTAGSTTYTSTAATFVNFDVGYEIVGTNIPPLTKVVSVVNANTVTLSQPATATGGGLSFAKGRSARPNVFLARLNTAGSGATSLVYSTYLGGNGDINFNGDEPLAVAADGAGNAYVTGWTVSATFPTTAGGYQPSFIAGGRHVFLSRVNTNVNTAAAAPTSLVYSTFLEGSNVDYGYALAADGSGDAWVGGLTGSSDFPTTTGAFQRTPNTCAGCGVSSGFVAEVNTAVSGAASLVYSTFLSGSSDRSLVQALALDHASPPNVTVVGSSDSGFPLVRPMQGGGQAILAELNGTGSSLVYSTYLGSNPGALAVGLDSASHPVVLEAAAVFKVDPTRDSGTFVTGVSPTGGPVSGGTQVVIAGGGLTGATKVKFGTLSAPSFTVNSDSQVTATAPVCSPGCGSVAAGTMAVTVTTASGTSLADTPATYYYGDGLFSGTGACPTGGCLDRAVTMASGKVLTLDTGVVDATLSPLAANLFSPAAGSWAAAQACPAGSSAPGSGCGKGSGSSLTLLNSGKVLLAGGEDPARQAPNAGSTAAAFLFDPASGTWAQTGSMTVARDHHSATLLANGKVLVAGGCTAACEGPNLAPLSSAELYDPVTGTWSATGSMGSGRAEDSASLLGSGQVLVAGGVSGAGGATVLASSEVFDPAGAGGVGAWSASGSMAAARYGQGAAVLASGKVLVVGGASGSSGTPMGSAELWDPAGVPNGSWSSAGSLAEARFAPDVVALPSGAVLVVGGGQSVAERYDPVSGSWGSATALAASPQSAAAVLLAAGPVSVCATNCGKVLVSSTPASLYTPRPAVVSVSPSNAAAGATVTVRGSGLASVTSVSFGTVAATNVAHDPASPDTVLTMTAPATSGTVDVTVSSPGGVSAVNAGDRFGAAANVVANFRGDNRTDVSVFRSSSGTWFVQNGVTLNYGTSGDVAVPADFDGDGTTDIAVFRPATGTWFMRSAAGADSEITYGVSSDIPVPADYDGVGKAEVAVFRPSTGAWYVHNPATGADTVVTFGISGDIPVPGDYDGVGHAEMAVFRPSSGTWFVRNPTTGAFSAVNYGQNGDVPVPGDYAGVGRNAMGVFRPSTGTWFTRNPVTGADTLITYGVSSDIPVPGDYDGVGSTEVAVFRPSTAAWYVHNPATGADTVTTFGVAADTPLPPPNAIRRFYG